jgi:chromosome segregation ATPase
MSEVENAVTGATAAPVSEETQEVQAQEVQQESATAESDEHREEQPRDEKGKFVQKRINELTKARYEAQRLAEQRERENAELRAQLQRYSNPPPDPNQDPEAYVRHLAEEAAERRFQERQQSWEQQQEQARFQEVASTFSQRANEYAMQHPDFAEAVEQYDHILGSDPMLLEVIASSEHGPAVAHYLGTHLDEAVKVAQMPPHLRVAHVARLEAKLSAPKTKPVTKAPAPAPTVGGSSALPGIRDGMDYEAYKAARMR